MIGKLAVVCLLFASLMFGAPPLAAQEFRFETRNAVHYVTHDGTALAGDLYLPEEGGKHAAIVAVHGGDGRSVAATSIVP